MNCVDRYYSWFYQGSEDDEAGQDNQKRVILVDLIDDEQGQERSSLECQGRSSMALSCARATGS